MHLCGMWKRWYNKNLCVTLCLLCGSLCNYYTELHRGDTENHRGQIAIFSSSVIKFSLGTKNKQPIIVFV